MLVAGIPVVATVHILNSNALRNERARADSALRAQLQGALETVGQFGDDASNRADDLSRSPALQHAFLTADRAALERLARQEPGVVFYLQRRRIAGTRPAVAITRSVSLTFNGRQVGTVLATVALDDRLGGRVLRTVPHARGDRLYIVRRGVAAGTNERLQIDGQTVRLAGRRYRGALSPVPNAAGVSLLALRSEKKIVASVRPYQQRVTYAALGSLALLVLLGFLFGRPLLRMLGDFRRVASQATTDALTGLANRRSFDEELALEWRRAHRIGDSLALVLLDLDDFKKVNDSHGHPAGDAVLRTIGEVLGAGVRQIDLAARYGGEEFVVLVPESDLKGATQLAKRLRLAVSKGRAELPDGRLLKVTASFGVAVKGDLASAEQLVAAADEALYEAKRAGKNRVVAAESGATDAPAETAAPKKKARARIQSDAGLGESGLRATRGRGARSGGQRRPAEGRQDRPGSKDPA
jgi:diguanylate cyclase (GGDEF)-like protein